MSQKQVEQSLSLGTKPVRRLLWEFAAPSIIAMSASSIYNLCDSIFIGQRCGALAIAGMAITFPMMNIITAFCIIASVGGSVLTSIYMGRQQRETANHILGNVLFLNFIFATMLCILGQLFLNPILMALGASDDTLPYAHQYMRIILMGVLVSHIFQSLVAQLRSTGFPRAMMRVQLTAVALNIIFDVLFIFGFGWGIQGAALATVLGQACALVTILPRFFTPENYLFFSRKMWNIRWTYIREIFSIGISPFLSNLSGFVIVLMVNLSLVRYGGDLYIGAFGITNRINQLLIMMVAGFGQGLQPIVGYNLGSGQHDRVRATMVQALIIVTVINTVGYLVIATFPSALASLFTSDAGLIDLCVPALRISMCTFPIVGCQFIAVAFFQAIHQAKLSILINLTRQLLVLLPLLFLLPPVLGANGVWWSMSLADCYSVLLAWYLLRKFKS